MVSVSKSSTKHAASTKKCVLVMHLFHSLDINKSRYWDILNIVKQLRHDFIISKLENSLHFILNYTSINLICCIVGILTISQLSCQLKGKNLVLSLINGLQLLFACVMCMWWFVWQKSSVTIL